MEPKSNPLKALKETVDDDGVTGVNAAAEDASARSWMAVLVNCMLTTLVLRF